MPIVTIQCGQAGNQLGQEFWGLLATQTQSRQPTTAASGTTTGAWGSSLSNSSEFFREDSHGRKHARCLLIDTEPKVVNSILTGCGSRGIFSRQNCFTGHSGRGNNWAYGYGQIIPNRAGGNPSRAPRWNHSTTLEDPSTLEFHLLDHVQEGIRKECEAIDSAPDFLMLHSLGGGSGSGMGSRILEHLREEYPLNYIATMSVAPRPAGDSPMQSLNSTMSLSFLQAYADVVMVYNNQAMLEAAMKVSKTASMADVNYHIATSALGALWPLSPGEPFSGGGRIRDMATTVAADPCLKLVESRTAALPATVGTKGLWRNASQAVVRLLPRFDILDANNPIVTSSVLLLARGFPSDTLQPSPPPKPLVPSLSGDSAAKIRLPMAASAVSEKAQSSGPKEVPFSAEASLQRRCRLCKPAMVPQALHAQWMQLSLFQGTPQAEASKRGALAGVRRPDNEAGGMAVTAIANRSSAIGLLSGLANRARVMSQTGAYLHWYERYGCSKAALDEALEVVDNMTDAYRLAHGIRDFL